MGRSDGEISPGNCAENMRGDMAGRGADIFAVCGVGMADIVLSSYFA